MREYRCPLITASMVLENVFGMKWCRELTCRTCRGIVSAPKRQASPKLTFHATDKGSTKLDLTPCLTKIHLLRVRWIDVENIMEYSMIIHERVRFLISIYRSSWTPRSSPYMYLPIWVNLLILTALAALQRQCNLESQIMIVQILDEATVSLSVNRKEIRPWMFVYK